MAGHLSSPQMRCIICSSALSVILPLDGVLGDDVWFHDCKGYYVNRTIRRGSLKPFVSCTRGGRPALTAQAAIHALTLAGVNAIPAPGAPLTPCDPYLPAWSGALLGALADDEMTTSNVGRI